MPRTQNNISPEVAQRLAEVARELREIAYGEAGCPQWGTKFDDIETQGMTVGLEVARLFMEQTIDQQAHDEVPPEFLECDGETAQPLGIDQEAQLETPAGEIGWDQPQARLSKVRRDFFPQAQALGLDVDQTLSPSMLEKVSYLGSLLKSFRQGEVAIEKLLNMTLGHKRIERLTERIGAERVAEVEQELEDFEALTLMEKVAGPPGITPPKSAGVMGDGGRFQRTDKNPDASSEKTTHWYEYKAGLCLELDGRRDGVEPGPDAVDPCPDVPTFLLNLEQMKTLTGEIGQQAAAVPEPDDEPAEGSVDLDSAESLSDLETLIEGAQAGKASSVADSAKELPLSPQVKSRDVVATSENSRRFGLKLAARAWRLGLFQATFKAFVADGSAWLWTIFEKSFKPFGFTPVLDIIHAVTYVYAAALAGRAESEGRPVYQQWVRWLWQGELSKVISALASRQAELGLPTDHDGETSPRRIVRDCLTYLQNQQSRMCYPEYRKLGLPITSSHMESAIKEMNYRIKGTEKFWSESGGESVLQLKSDTLSASDPLSTFWRNRQTNRTGLHNSVGKRKSTVAA